MHSFFHGRRTVTTAFASTLAACVTIALASCYTSPDPATMKLAQSPRGVEAKFYLADRSRGTTELLAVTDTGFVVLRGGRVVFVRYERVRTVSFRKVGFLDLQGTRPNRKLRERLSYMSRFPFGLNDAVLAELLSIAGQQAPDTIAARRR